jgi:hypothetical protein
VVGDVLARLPSKLLRPNRPGACTAPAIGEVLLDVGWALELVLPPRITSV